MVLTILHYQKKSYRKLVSCHKLLKAFFSHFSSLLFSCSLLSFIFLFCLFVPQLYSPSPLLHLSPSPLHGAPEGSGCSWLWRYITRGAKLDDSWGFEYLWAWSTWGGVFTWRKRNQKGKGTQGLYKDNFLRERGIG